MGSIDSLNIFVRAAETRSFTIAGQQLGLSASAISKAMMRLEERLAVRLFHRSTRSVTLTPEGGLFLERCRRILCEMEAAETELSQLHGTPRGRLKISLPSAVIPLMSRLVAFRKRSPDIELDIDCSDRLVDIVDEGFDAVIRSGKPSDSRLMTRTIGSYRRLVVGAPDYFERHGVPQQPEDLAHHACLLYRFPATGKINAWQLSRDGQPLDLELPVAMIANTLEPLLCFAEQGLGLACVPDLSVRCQIEAGRLVSVLDAYSQSHTVFRLVWPSSQHLSPKLRVFIDFVAENLFTTAGPALGHFLPQDPAPARTDGSG